MVYFDNINILFSQLFWFDLLGVFLLEYPKGILFTIDHMETRKFVINLSKIKLSNDQISLLSKGLSFCPTPGEPDPG